MNTYASCNLSRSHLYLPGDLCNCTRNIDYTYLPYSNFEITVLIQYT